MSDPLFSSARLLTRIGVAAVVLGLSGCPGDAPVPAAPTAEVAPAAAAADAGGQLAAARKLLASGKAADAVRAGEAMITAHPEDDAAWDFTELAALRAGTAAELVDRLAADQAIGGRTDRHHALRGILAIEANRLGDALTAARALESVSPGDAAAIVALAVKRGAPLPEGASAAVAALVAGGAMTPEVDALPGWRAAVARAEARLAAGDGAGAAMDVARVETASPRAAEQIALVRIRAAADPAQAWTVGEAAARAALEAGDATGAAQLLDAAFPRAAGAWKASEVAKVAGELRAAATAAGDVASAAQLAAIEADASLRAGRPLAARTAATAAAAEASQKARASWTLALAEAALGNPAGVSTASAALGDPRAAAARDLARALHGESVRLPSSGLSGADAALSALIGAGWLDDPLPALAVAASEAVDAPDLALWASVAGGRGPIAVPEGASTPLQAEVAARTWLAGDGAVAAFPVVAPGTADAHPNAEAWMALVSGTGAPAAGVGVRAWPGARAALAAGDSATATHLYGTLALGVPAWRTGPWAPVLVLDGPVPEEVGVDAANNAKASDPLPVGVVFHGWHHRRMAALGGWQHGVTPFPPTATPDQRLAVWDAAAGYRAATLTWLAGHGAWPAAAQATLDTAERDAGLVKTQSPTLSALRTALDADALLSFRTTAGSGVEALYLTSERGKIVQVKSSVVRATADYLAALRKSEASVELGNSLRADLLDGNMDVLLGVGRYVVVGGPPLGLVPIAALPEQADGLRYLAAIRNVGYLPDFDSILPVQARPDDEFSLTMVAFCPTVDDCEAVRRVYPDTVPYSGATATIAAWRTNAPKARFVYLGGFPATPDGGFKFHDGPLTLREIATTSLVVRGIAVDGGDSAEIGAARLHALRRAGATEILLEGPARDKTLRSRLLLHFWEGLNLRHSASRSLTEARSLSIREAGEPAQLPGYWSGYFVSGRP